MIQGSKKYAYRGTSKNGVQRRVYMHQQLVTVPEGFEIDHVNRNGLDNRRENLRLVTHTQNLANSKLNSRNTSGFRGVALDKKRRKWFCSIRVSGKTKALGRFTDPKAAAHVWNQAALEAWGSFANLNAV